MSEAANDKKIMKVSKMKVSKIYSLLLEQENFQTFAVSDIIRRGKEIIEAIRSDDDLDFDELKVLNMNKLLKANGKKRLSDPKVVCFQVKMLLKLGKLSFETENNALVTSFEILLALSILFCIDLESKATETLLDCCFNIIRMASENLGQIEQNEYVLKNLLDSKLIKWVSNGLNFENYESLNKRKSLLLEI